MLFKTKKKKIAAEQDVDSSTRAQDKTELRRAQVRKAQIQHRQRKANYVKQLEIDVARIRNLIATAQREAQDLKGENDSMRAAIRQAGTQLSGSQDQDALSLQLALSSVYSTTEAGLDLQDLDDITLTIAMDEIMNSPTYRVSSSPSLSNYKASEESLGPPLLPDMSAEQIQEAINFVLALENVCWDHFRLPDFESDREPTGPESGHTLMATSLALRTAPPAVFASVAHVKENMKSRQKEVRAAPVPSDISWDASGLTLQSLYGLACSINPADVDITPVQAFFELASRYPLELLMRADILNNLKRELFGVVKCPHYGAAMERNAFESVVGRVVDSELTGFQAQQPKGGN